MDLLLTLLALLGWLLLAVMALLLLVFVLPFHLRAVGAVDSEQEAARLPLAAMAYARGSWAWGLLSIGWGTETGGEVRVLGIRVARLEDDTDGEKKDKRREKKRKKKEEKGKKYGARWAMRHRRTMLGLLGKVFGALRLRLHVSGVLGIGDPADTVILAELLRLAESELPGASLDIQVDYLDEVLVMDGELSGRIWLLGLAGMALWELRRREVRQMLAGR